ncbi:MAG: AAA family ATPase [Succinivibrionaceae bacterium]|nr:AAA family ATPase [Succinivibrionaceae bacterium]
MEPLIGKMISRMKLKQQDPKLLNAAIRVGGDDFSAFCQGGYTYVDKTAFLQPLFEDPEFECGAQLLAPHMFGKTLFLSMIQRFAEIDYSDPDRPHSPMESMEDLEIIRNKDFTGRHMGRYPVVRLNLGKAGCSTYSGIFIALAREISREFRRFADLPAREKFSEVDTEAFAFLGRLDREEELDGADGDFRKRVEGALGASVALLCNMLRRVYGRSVLLLVDDVDVPVASAALLGFGDRIRDLLYSMLSLPLTAKGVVSKFFFTSCRPAEGMERYREFHHLRTVDLVNRKPMRALCMTRNEFKTLAQNSPLTMDQHKTCDLLSRGYFFVLNEVNCTGLALRFMEHASAAENRLKKDLYDFDFAFERMEMPDLWNLHAGTGEFRKLENLLSGGEEAVERIQLFSNRMYPTPDALLSFDDFAAIMVRTGTLGISHYKNRREEVWVDVKVPNPVAEAFIQDKVQDFLSPNNPAWMDMTRCFVSALLAGDQEEAERMMRLLLSYFIHLPDSKYADRISDFLMTVLTRGCESMDMETDIALSPLPGGNAAAATLTNPASMEARIIVFGSFDAFNLPKKRDSYCEWVYEDHLYDVEKTPFLAEDLRQLFKQLADSGLEERLRHQGLAIAKVYGAVFYGQSYQPHAAGFMNVRFTRGSYASVYCGQRSVLRQRRENATQAASAD